MALPDENVMGYRALQPLCCSCSPSQLCPAAHLSFAAVPGDSCLLLMVQCRDCRAHVGTWPVTYDVTYISRLDLVIALGQN
jgi:hypothetical protein